MPRTEMDFSRVVVTPEVIGAPYALDKLVKSKRLVRSPYEDRGSGVIRLYVTPVPFEDGDIIRVLEEPSRLAPFHKRPSSLDEELMLGELQYVDVQRRRLNALNRRLGTHFGFPSKF